MKKLLLLLALSTAASAQAPSATTLAHKVDAHYNHLHSLTAHFTERYRGMGIDRTESGTLTLSKPGRMRWAYDAPSGKVFVLDNHFAISYTPGDSQAERTPAKELDDLRSPLRFLLGHTQLAKELDHLTTAPSGPNFVITGVPKGMAQRVRQLTLIVTPTGIIQAMKLEETDGAVTSFTFTNIDENTSVPATAFTFTPPPGIAVVDGQSPI